MTAPPVARDAEIMALRDEFIRLHPVESARALESRPDAEVADVLASVPEHDAARLIERLSPEQAAAAITRVEPSRLAVIGAALDPVRGAAIVAHLDEDQRERALVALGGAVEREIRELLDYPADTAGALMDPRVLSVPRSATAGELLAQIRARRPQRGGGHDVDDIYVVDDDQRLLGRAPLDELVLVDPGQRVDAIRLVETPTIADTASRDEAVERMRDEAGDLPVVDFDARLVGVIRATALRTAAQEELSASLQTMVGVSRDERALSPPSFAVRKRLPWLMINLLTAFLAAAVVGVFEGTIARFTALAVLLPVVAGQSGNSGAQALAVTMRGLALREVRTSHWRRLLMKEGAVGAANGVAIAAVTAVGVMLWSSSPGLGLVIGVAMVLSMTIAGVAGASVPIVLRALGQDPAQSSSIVLTTVTDVAGFTSFLGLATVLSGLL